MNVESPEDDWDSDGKHPGRAFKLVLLGLVLAALAGIWSFVAGHVLIEPKERVVPVPVVDRYPEDPEEAIRLARETWERFVEAPNLSSRLLEVRDSDRVRTMVEDFHLQRGHRFPTMEGISECEPVTLGQRRMMLFRVRGFDGKVYPVSVEWSNDRFLVDWESLSAYGTMDWAVFAEERPGQTQTMRVYLAGLSESLKPPINVEGIWDSFRMEHRDSSDTLVVAAADSLALEIAGMVEGKRVPVTVEVRWNDGIGQFELVRLVARTWSL